MAIWRFFRDKDVATLMLARARPFHIAADVGHISERCSIIFIWTTVHNQQMADWKFVEMKKKAAAARAHPICAQWIRASCKQSGCVCVCTQCAQRKEERETIAMKLVSIFSNEYFQLNLQHNRYYSGWNCDEASTATITITTARARSNRRSTIHSMRSILS